MSARLSPTVGRLVRSLTPEQQLVALARTLHHEGYDDHTTGHITYKQPDGTLLVNPFELTWDELTADDVMRISTDGTVLEGRHSVTPAITLHVELHRAREDVTVALHGHPRHATVWACMRRIPPVYDQTSGITGVTIGLHDDYGGSVDKASEAVGGVAALEHAHTALLANHGVFVIADSIEMAYLRASTLEWRARRASEVESQGGGTPLRDDVVAALERYAIEHLSELPMFEAEIRRAIRRDPSWLGTR